jgi:hypothetical protein
MRPDARFRRQTSLCGGAKASRPAISVISDPDLKSFCATGTTEYDGLSQDRDFNLDVNVCDQCCSG